MAMEISKAFYDGLSFNLDAALADYTAAMEAHKLTVGVPAPHADPVVEAVFRAGGYVIVEPPEAPPANPLDPNFNIGLSMNRILTG